jgi:hypothetical protein
MRIPSQDIISQDENKQGSVQERKKADTAAGLQSMIYNLKFALTLAGLCDIYSVISRAVQVLQV